MTLTRDHDPHTMTPAATPCPGVTIAVIIPVLNEASALPATLAAIGAGHRIIVADGGSEDDSRAVAAAAGAHVILCAPPRARQLNQAAALAETDILLFLHADTALPQGWAAETARILSASDAILGAFRLSIADARKAERFVAAAANWRSTAQQLPYGDQSLFIRRGDFEALGGFPEMPIMDDYLFVKRARARGRVVISPLAVITSNRRWRKLGVWRTTLRNQLVIAGYHAGINLERLRRYYRA